MGVPSNRQEPVETVAWCCTGWVPVRARCCRGRGPWFGIRAQTRSGTPARRGTLLVHGGRPPDVMMAVGPGEHVLHAMVGTSRSRRDHARGARSLAYCAPKSTTRTGWLPKRSPLPRSDLPPPRRAPLRMSPLRIADMTGPVPLRTRPTALRRSARPSGRWSAAPEGAGRGLQQVAGMRRARSLHQPLLRGHVREGDHPGQPAMYTGEYDGGRRHGLM